ncbi:MAG: cytochrome c biogenesis protein CcsA [Candidatus Eisenbacteria bacterium]
MNPYMRALASLKLTVGLLIVLAIAMSFGTIIDSTQGMDAAQVVYGASWFYALQALFCLNVIAALWERWPRNRYRIGFAVTHASMLLIFGGALLTLTQAVDGQLPLWEGESSARFHRTVRGHDRGELGLPFTVRLDDYQMEFYPGTMRPAQFRSHLTIVDGGREHRADVYMNHPYRYRGWTFFQSSYQIENGREMTVLSVSRDPGMPVVFWGYYLLMIGMVIVLVTRIAQFRDAERVRAATKRSGLGVPIVARGAAIALLALGGVAAGAGHARAQHQHGPPALPPAGMVEALGRMPVQHDGREMPFDTQAREAVRAVTGQHRWQGQDPVATVMGWQMDQHGWLEAPIIKVDAHVAQLVGAAPGTRHVSFNTLLTSVALRREIGPAIERAQADQPPQPGDKPLLKLDERITVFDAYLRGDGIFPVPGATRAQKWTAPANPTDPASFAAVEPMVRRNPPAFYPTPGRIAVERTYHAVNPVGIAWWLLLPAAILAGLTLERDRLRMRGASTVLSIAGFLVMSWAIATRWQFAERIPASNMYESMMFLGWGVGLFSVAALFFRNRIPTFNAAAMAALTMFLLDRLPMDPFVHPMAPVLAGTPWLAIHVPIIMVSYSTFAIATFLAHAQLGVELFRPSDRAAIQKWADLLYWYIMVGSILLVAGIITGSIWASESWGTYWGWDPKEVWSLVAFLAYMAILHARSDGQMASFGVAAWSIVGFWTILMTYLGVNFVLGTGMHSYGMGSSNIVNSMLAVGGIEAVFLFVCWYRRAARQVALEEASAKKPA